MVMFPHKCLFRDVASRLNSVAKVMNDERLPAADKLYLYLENLFVGLSMQA
jgi:hypothetical protein